MHTAACVAPTLQTTVMALPGMHSPVCRWLLAEVSPLSGHQGRWSVLMRRSAVHTHAAVGRVCMHAWPAQYSCETASGQHEGCLCCRHPALQSLLRTCCPRVHALSKDPASTSADGVTSLLAILFLPHLCSQAQSTYTLLHCCMLAGVRPATALHMGPQLDRSAGMAAAFTAVTNIRNDRLYRAHSSLHLLQLPRQHPGLSAQPAVQ